jgi:outer membrane receptor for ferrienterochelin and colicins
VRKRFEVTSLAILAAATLAARARAGDDDELQGLLQQSVISTASRSAETTSDAPATATTLTAEDLRRYNIRSVSEAINFLAMGMITTSSPNAVDIGARGVMLAGDNGNHVLFLRVGIIAGARYQPRRA